MIYALVTFGSPLPSTLQAKIAQGQSGYFAPFLRTSAEWLAAYILKTPHLHHAGASSLYLIIVVLAAIGSVSLLLHPQFRWWAILIWLGLYAAGYSLLGVPFYHWYVAPFAIGETVLAGLGAQFGYDLIQVGIGSERSRKIILIAFIGVLTLPLIAAFNFIRSYALSPLT